MKRLALRLGRSGPLDTILHHMLPEEGSNGDERDATLAQFGHVVGHGCAACRVIRRLGPKGVGNHCRHTISSGIGRGHDETRAYDLATEIAELGREIHMAQRERAPAAERIIRESQTALYRELATLTTDPDARRRIATKVARNDETAARLSVAASLTTIRDAA